MTYYLYPRPGQTEPTAKMVYARHFAPWDATLSSGLYVDVLDADVSALLVRLGSLGAGVLGIMALLSWLIASDILGALRRLQARAADVQDPELRAALVRLGARIAASRRGLALGALGTLLMARSPRAQEVDKLLGVLPTDHVLGRPDAPNIIIDYFSLTCPHCANFHAAVFPVLRRDWIDTGRLRFIYRHFPSDAVATRGSLLAECGGAKFFETIDTLFKSQVDWLTAPNPEEEMVGVMERAGLAARDCLADGRLFDKVVGDVQSGQALGVKFTPTLFINEQRYGNPEGGALGIDAILRQVGR